MDGFRQDLIYALRRLRSAPGFTIVAVLTLALGIGANTALFSIVNGVLLRPLPYPEPQRLVRVVGTYEGRNVVMSPANMLDVRAAAKTLAGLSAYDNSAFTLTGRGEPQRLGAAVVGASFFDVLDVAPALGRGFQEGENEPGRERVSVLSHGLWQDAFGGDPAVLGRSIVLDGQPYVVVGVAPPGFAFPEVENGGIGTQVWVPMLHDKSFLEGRGAWYLGTVGRLREGVSLDEARAELRTIGARLASQYKEQNEGLGVSAIPLRDHVVGDVARALTVLLGAVGLVLLIACVNVANLLLARQAGRRAELAIRTALGAARGRIVRQLLTEAVVLAVAGTTLGLFLAHWGRELFLALQPGDLPRAAETEIDRTVLLFCAGLSALTALLFGAAPALAATRRDPSPALREGGRGLLSRGRLGPSLVVAEVGLAVTLLVGAGLLLRSFSELRRVDPGFAAPNALTFRTALPEALYAEEAQRIAFYRTLEERLASLPGVSGIGATLALPMSDVRLMFAFEVAGRAPLPPAQQPSLETRVVTPGYFRAIGMPLLAGRAFTEADRAAAPAVVVLSRSAVRRHFPDEDPLGKRIVLGWGGPSGPKAGGVVVGVVGDVKDHGLGEEHPAEIYLPYAQRPLLNMSFVLRTAGDPTALASGVRAALRELDPNLPLLRVQTLDEIVSRSIARPRFYASVLGFFASAALGLAALGVFGVLSYGVSQRSREIGVRLALGARPGDVLRMVLREAVLLSAAGLAVGLAAALLLSRTLASLLFNVGPADPATLASVMLVLGAAALLAGALPAWRAARVDPLQALRTE